MTYERIPPPLIELKDVSKSYGGAPPVLALKEVSIKVDRGESVAIVGPSGSGKSTLLNVLGLLDVPSHGDYLFQGSSLKHANEITLGSIRGQKFGFVFQAFHLMNNRSVLENVELAMMYANVPLKDRRARATRALQSLGLEHKVNSEPRQLSGGERQRTAIARAICLQPEVLFCDEPTGNLDTANADRVLESLLELNSLGQTLVVVTHNPDLARELDRIITVRDGEIVPSVSSTRASSHDAS